MPLETPLWVSDSMTVGSSPGVVILFVGDQTYPGVWSLEEGVLGLHLLPDVPRIRRCCRRPVRPGW